MRADGAKGAELQQLDLDLSALGLDRHRGPKVGGAGGGRASLCLV